MKKLLILALVTYSSLFAATVSDEETTKIKEYSTLPTSIYIKPTCIDGYKFIITVTGQGAISTIQIFEGSYSSLLPIRCKKEQQ
jgi:hypothetical protein